MSKTNPGNEDGRSGRPAAYGSATVRPIFLWLPVGLWAAFIALATSTPGSRLPRPPFPHFDLLVHGILYGVLGLLLHRAISRGTRLRKRGWSVAFVVALAYAIIDEVHQLWIPNRSFALGDILADAAGAALGILLYASWSVMRGRLTARPTAPSPDKPE